MERPTKKERRQHAAILSRNPNRILLAFDRWVATALFYHGLNAVTASKMSDEDLLKLNGIGPICVRSIRMAINTAENTDGEKFVSPFCPRWISHRTDDELSDKLREIAGDKLC